MHDNNAMPDPAPVAVVNEVAILLVEEGGEGS